MVLSRVTKNPYNFQHFDVSEVSLTDGGREVDGHPLHFDFAKNQYVEGYWGLFRALDNWIIPKEMPKEMPSSEKTIKAALHSMRSICPRR